MSIDFVVEDNINEDDVVICDDDDDDDELECRICSSRHKSSIMVMANPELKIRSTRCCCSNHLIEG